MKRILITILLLFQFTGCLSIRGLMTRFSDQYAALRTWRIDWNLDGKPDRLAVLFDDKRTAEKGDLLIMWLNSGMVYEKFWRDGKGRIWSQRFFFTPKRVWSVYIGKERIF